MDRVRRLRLDLLRAGGRKPFGDGVPGAIVWWAIPCEDDGDPWVAMACTN